MAGIRKDGSGEDLQKWIGDKTFHVERPLNKLLHIMIEMISAVWCVVDMSIFYKMFIDHFARQIVCMSHKHRSLVFCWILI